MRLHGWAGKSTHRQGLRLQQRYAAHVELRRLIVRSISCTWPPEALSAKCTTRLGQTVCMQHAHARFPRACRGAAIQLEFCKKGAKGIDLRLMSLIERSIFNPARRLSQRRGAPTPSRCATPALRLYTLVTLNACHASYFLWPPTMCVRCACIARANGLHWHDLWCELMAWYIIDARIWSRARAYAGASCLRLV